MSIELKDLVHAAGDEVIGKIRLQKMVYLLDQLGLQSGFSFSYHYYGPYSSELTDVVDFDVVLGDLVEESRNRKSDGVPYSIYRTPSTYEQSSNKIGQFDANDARDFIRAMNNYSSTELELAATAHWLAKQEGIGDWRKELVRRKGVKTEDGRTERALELLERLGLNLE